MRLRHHFNVVHKLSAQNFIRHTAKVIDNEVLPSYMQKQYTPSNALLAEGLVPCTFLSSPILHLAAARNRVSAPLGSSCIFVSKAPCVSPSLHPCLRQCSFLVALLLNFDHQLLITSLQPWLLMFILSFS